MNSNGALYSYKVRFPRCGKKETKPEKKTKYMVSTKAKESLASSYQVFTVYNKKTMVPPTLEYSLKNPLLQKLKHYLVVHLGLIHQQ